jgi:hypothetical protein
LIHGRSEQPLDHQFGHGLRNVHHQAQWADTRSTLDGVDELASQAEGLVRVAVGDLPDLGQHQAASLFLEQAFAERAFELFDLRADRGVRELQSLGRARHAALAHDQPEALEVGS